jgi:hypothetical protein
MTIAVMKDTLAKSSLWVALGSSVDNHARMSSCVTRAPLGDIWDCTASHRGRPDDSFLWSPS